MSLWLVTSGVSRFRDFRPHDPVFQAESPHALIGQFPDALHSVPSPACALDRTGYFFLPPGHPHADDGFRLERRGRWFPVYLLDDQLDCRVALLLLAVFAVAHAEQALTIFGQQSSGPSLPRFENLTSPHKMPWQEAPGRQ